MTRPRRKPAIPNLVLVLCTDRGQEDHGKAGKQLAALQGFIDEDGDLRFRWIPRGKGARSPVTGRRRGKWHTFEVECRICGRNPQIHEERLGERVRALAAGQRTGGRRPVPFDISDPRNAL